MKRNHPLSAVRDARRRALAGILRTITVAAVCAIAAIGAIARADHCCEETLCCPPACDCELDCSSTLRSGDEAWLISTRCLGCPRAELVTEPPLEVSRFAQGVGWQTSSVHEFLAATGTPGGSAAPPTTVFYVHGNHIDSSAAIDEGWRVYHRLVDGDASPPLHYVIFSWPSDKIRGPIRDFREKALRADTDAFYLGWLLDRMDPTTPVSLIGYSYGARVVTGGLHVAAGGRSAGAVLEEIASPPGLRRARVVLWAGAVHSWWLYPGERHELALSQIDGLLNLYNTCDAALKRYHVVEKCYDPSALGYTGFTCCQRFGADAARVRQADVCSTIGISHRLARYLCSECLMERVRREVFWLPIE